MPSGLSITGKNPHSAPPRAPGRGERGWPRGPPGRVPPVPLAWAQLCGARRSGPALGLREVVSLQLWLCFCESVFGVSRLTVCHCTCLHLPKRPPPEPFLG